MSRAVTHATANAPPGPTTSPRSPLLVRKNKTHSPSKDLPDLCLNLLGLAKGLGSGPGVRVVQLLGGKDVFIERTVGEEDG